MWSFITVLLFGLFLWFFLGFQFFLFHSLWRLSLNVGILQLLPMPFYYSGIYILAYYPAADSLFGKDLTSNFRSYFVLFSYILDYLCHYIISGRTTLYLRLIIQVIIFTFRIFDFTFVIRELGSYCWVFIFPLALYRLIFIIPGSCCWFLLEYTIIIFWLLVVALFLFLFPYHYIINYIYIFVLFSFLLFIIWFLISLHFIAKKPNIKRKKENKRTKM